MFAESLGVFVSAEVGSSRRLRDRVVRSGLGSRRDSTAARPRSRLRPLPEPAGSPEGAPGAEPPAASHTPAGSRPPASTLVPSFLPDPSSNMSPNLPRMVSAAGQRRMDSSHSPGRPPAVRHPPDWRCGSGKRPFFLVPVQTDKLRDDRSCNEHQHSTF